MKEVSILREIEEAQSACDMAKQDEKKAIDCRHVQLNKMQKICKGIMDDIRKIGLVEIDQEYWVRFVMYDKGKPKLLCDKKEHIYVPGPSHYSPYMPESGNQDFLGVGVHETAGWFHGDAEEVKDTIAYPKEWFEEEDWTAKYREVFDPLLSEVLKSEKEKESKKEEEDKALFSELKARFEPQQ